MGTPNIQVEGTQQSIKFPESPKTLKKWKFGGMLQGFKNTLKFFKNICNMDYKISVWFLLYRGIIFWNIIVFKRGYI